jgi:ferric-chelate reductase
MRLVVCPLLFSPDVTPASDAAMSRAASVSAPTTHGVNNQALVFHTDLFLAALAACWIAGQLPFLLARFSRAAEWRGWHTLRPARVRAWRAEPPAGVDGQVARRRSTAPPDRRPVPPPHVRSWSSRMVRFARFLQRPLDRGTSVGQACMLVGYFVVLLYPFFYRSNPFTDPLRAGYVALSQLPVAFALAMRNSPPGTLAGVSYEKVGCCSINESMGY